VERSQFATPFTVRRRRLISFRRYSPSTLQSCPKFAPNCDVFQSLGHQIILRRGPQLPSCEPRAPGFGTRLPRLLFLNKNFSLFKVPSTVTVYVAYSDDQLLSRTPHIQTHVLKSPLPANTQHSHNLRDRSHNYSWIGYSVKQDLQLSRFLSPGFEEAMAL